MKHSIKLVVKDEQVYCRNEKSNVNIHSMTHPITKVRISKVCDSWNPNCPEGCRYFNQSKK